MADVRTLKLNLLADVDQFGKGLKTAEGNTKSFSSKMKGYGKVAAKAFAGVAAAAGGMAIAIGVDSVKAAIEDQKSSRILETQLKKTLKANDKMVASVEDYISATQLRVGVQDDKLRPAFGRLIRSTKDAEEAQKLLNLALDISVATGKPLETVSNALGKAYDGNAQALGRLGLGIDSAVLKGNDFDEIGKELTATFGGFANTEVESLDGKMRIVGIRFDELKEKMGAKLIPVLGDVLEQVNLVAMGFSGEDQKKGLSNKVKALSTELDGGKSGGIALGESLAILAKSFGDMFAALSSGNATTGVSALESTANAITKIATAITKLSEAYKKLKPFVKYLPSSRVISEIGDYLTAPGKATGGFVKAGQAVRVGEFGPETFIPSGAGTIQKASSSMGGNTVININGIVDAASARRSIERLLQTQSRISGPINLAGAMP
jgi:hypothetical protein